MSTIKLQFDRTVFNNMIKGIARETEISNGLRVPTHKVHKNKKLYTRKQKHKQYI